MEINNNELTAFIKSAKNHIKKIDSLMEEKESFERGKKIAQAMNEFELNLDGFLVRSCNVHWNDLSKITNKTWKIKQK